jgi:hypothetical protein
MRNFSGFFNSSTPSKIPTFSGCEDMATDDILAHLSAVAFKELTCF